MSNNAAIISQTTITFLQFANTNYNIINSMRSFSESTRNFGRILLTQQSHRVLHFDALRFFQSRQREFACRFCDLVAAHVARTHQLVESSCICVCAWFFCCCQHRSSRIVNAKTARANEHVARRSVRSADRRAARSVEYTNSDSGECWTITSMRARADITA